MTIKMTRKNVIAEMCMIMVEDFIGDGTTLCDLEINFPILYKRINNFGWCSLRNCELLTLYYAVTNEDTPIEIID